MKQFVVFVWCLAILGCEDAPKHICNPDDVTLKAVSVTEVEKAIANHKGKVVMVDVWFLGCSPCVKKFPKVVELHAKYADKGVTVISVDVMPAEVAYKEKVQAFLKAKCADFPNYILDDEQDNVDNWNEKYGLEFTPATLLFGKDGKRIAIDPDADLSVVENAIAKALKE